MDFEITHTLDGNVDAVAAVMLDQDFQESLKDLPALADRQLLSQTENADGSVTREVRCVLGINIPSAARGFIGSGDPAWVEEAVWDPATHRWDWAIKPEVGGDLLQAAGSIALAAAGGRTERTVAGIVKVRVPIYGSRVEGWIVDGLRRAYAEEAERLEEWLTERA